MNTPNPDRRQQATAMVRDLTVHGYMNGWCGDRSEEFQQEQINLLCALSETEWKQWVATRSSNLSWNQEQ